MNHSTVLETFGVVRADGTLDLEQKLPGTPRRVRVRVEEMENNERSFPPGYFDLIGSVDDETLVIHPQPPMPPPLEVE